MNQCGEETTLMKRSSEQFMRTLYPAEVALRRHSLLVGCLQQLPSEESKRYGKGEKNFTVKKPDKYYLSQVIRVNLNCDKNVSLIR